MAKTLAIPGMASGRGQESHDRQPGLYSLEKWRVRKGLAPRDVSDSEQVTRRLASALDRWADHVEPHLDVKTIVDALHLSVA